MKKERRNDNEIGNLPMTEKQVCYVCKQTITVGGIYVGKIAEQETWRHKSCFPGSEEWKHAQSLLPEEEQSPFFKEFFKEEAV